MEILGNPQDSLKCVHVAGTNGKGSTCAFIESILRCAGYKTGLFTSPYIEKFEERIRVNNENIPLDRLTEITLRVKDAAEQVDAEQGEHPTEFELMTAVAFVYFAEEKCDYCVIEVGLGGRLDSTNIITPVVSVITKIGMDHTAMLGDTIEKIAAEKAGIIKPGIPVVIAPNQPSTIPGIMLAKTEQDPRDGARSQLIQAEVCKLPLGLSAEYQKENAGNAVAVAKLLGIDEKFIEQGLLYASWPGRFEKFEVDGRTVIVDGAHNPDGAQALAKSLKSAALRDDFATVLEERQSRVSKGGGKIPQGPHAAKYAAVFGILRDKNYEEVLNLTKDCFSEYYLYEPSNPRALPVDEIPVDGVKCESAVDALQKALKNSRNIVVCYGSLYSIGELRSYLNSL